MTDQEFLEEKYLDRLLSIRANTPDDAECMAALQGVVDELAIDIQCARAKGDRAEVEKYESLRAFVKDVI